MHDCQLQDECQFISDSSFHQFISDIKVHNRERGKEDSYKFLAGSMALTAFNHWI